MAYLNTLSGWKELQNSFKGQGFKIDFSLDNIPYFEKEGKDVDYDALPEGLKLLADAFAENNGLN